MIVGGLFSCLADLEILYLIDHELKVMGYGTNLFLDARLA